MVEAILWFIAFAMIVAMMGFFAGMFYYAQEGEIPFEVIELWGRAICMATVGFGIWSIAFLVMKLTPKITLALGLICLYLAYLGGFNYLTDSFFELLRYYFAESAAMWGIFLIGWLVYAQINNRLDSSSRNIRVLVISGYSFAVVGLSLPAVWIPLWGIFFLGGVAIGHFSLFIWMLPTNEWEKKLVWWQKIPLYVILIVCCVAMVHSAYESLKEGGLVLDSSLVILILGMMTALITQLHFNVELRERILEFFQSFLPDSSWMLEDYDDLDRRVDAIIARSRERQGLE